MSQNDKRIYLNSPDIGVEEQKVMLEVTQSGWLSTAGPHLELFEDMLSLFYGGRRVLLLNSGTAAVHLALKCIGIKKGDYVLCADFSFCASSNPIVYEGGIPVFIDSEPNGLGISPSHVERAIKNLNKLPAAIIVVHAYGIPAQMDELNTMAARFGIPVIEDSAQALGSTHHENQCGALGDFGVLSFNGNKIVTTGGGGALIFKNKSDYDKAYALSIQGNINGDYNYNLLGYNYRMTNLAAGLGIAQFKQLATKLKRKTEIHHFYATAIGELGGCYTLTAGTNQTTNYWLNNIIFDEGIERIGLIQTAAQKGNIEVKTLWSALSEQHIYQERLYFGQGYAKKLTARGLSLPSSTSLSQSDLDRIVDSLFLLVKS